MTNIPRPPRPPSSIRPSHPPAIIVCPVCKVATRQLELIACPVCGYCKHPEWEGDTCVVCGANKKQGHSIDWDFAASRVRKWLRSQADGLNQG
jgi:hypothetical protein